MATKEKSGYNLHISKKTYKEHAAKFQTKRNVILNVLRAFWVGGAICLFGQFVSNIYITYFGFSKQDASNPTVATLIFLAVLLTGLGVYDKIGQYAGAGSAVPVTGFANSISSAAIEHRSEGYVLGVGGNMFKLAGSVIVFGVFAAFVFGTIRTIMKIYMGI